MAKKIDAYELEPAFERKVVLLLAKRPKFYGVIGHAIEPDALGLASSKLIVKAVKAIAKDTGTGPSDHAVLLQRIRRWVDEGSVTQEALDDVIDVLIEAPSTLPPEAEVVAELRPVLQRRIQGGAVRAAMEEFARRGDFESVRKMLDQADSLGSYDTSTGLRLGKAAFSEIERLRNIDRMPFGITELDIALDGGLPRGCQAVYAAAPGGGKSQLLAHVTAHAVKRGYFAVVATLELNRAAWLARVMANLTGVPINTIMSSDQSDVAARIEAMYPVLGTLIVMDFPAKLTSMKDLCGWVDSCAEEEGYRPHLFVVDYADKCKSHLADDQRRGEYDAQGTVYETHRLYCAEHAMWGFTASQPRRAAGKEKRRRIELDDLAESNKKAHVTDLLVTGQKTPDGDMIEYYVPKFRYGKSDISVGPLPHDWACGRQVMASE